MTYFWENPTFTGNRASTAVGPWTTAYVDRLPDSAFLIVYKGKRHLPVKNHFGNYDCTHLSNAESRANQVKGVSAAERRRAKKRASDLYDRYCKK